MRKPRLFTYKHICPYTPAPHYDLKRTLTNNPG